MRDLLKKLFHESYKRSRWMRVLYTLAVVVVFVTTYALIIPAITMSRTERVLDCQYHVHQHTEDCYAEGEDGTLRLVCGMADYVIHEHTPDCYDADGDLICPLPEITEPIEDGSEQFSAVYTSGSAIALKVEQHVHTSSCFREVPLQADDTVRFTGRTETMRVSVEADPDAFPEGTEMVVRDVLEPAVLDSIAEAVEGDVVYVHAVDISFLYEGTEIEPALPIRVTMSLLEKQEEAQQAVVHMDRDGEVSVVDQEDSSEREVVFEADRFSVYAIVGTTIEKTVLAGDGNNYRISVSFGPEAGVPEDAELDVAELSGDLYADYLAKSAVAMDAAGFAYARIFDIAIVDAEGDHITPSAPVEVSVSLQDASRSGEDFSVLHFEDDADTPVQVDTETSGSVVTFTTESFSAYAIVQGPDPISDVWKKISSLSDLIDRSSEGLYIGHVDGYYMTDGITRINASRTGITKTKPAQAYPADGAVPYYFEQIAGTSDQFRIYCMPSGEKKYVIQSTNSLNFTTVESSAGVFTLENGDSPDVFRFKGSGGYYWNMQGGASGKSIAAYTGAADTNAQFYIWRYEDLTEEPFGLDGKSYGLMNWTGGMAGKAMMASATGDTLDALALTVMTKAGGDADKLFVPSDSDISLWTFEWIEQDKYRLTATVDGAEKYLRITSSGLSLADVPDEACDLQVVPGTGAHAGEICLISGGNTLTFSGTVAGGFGVGGSAGSEWLHLVDLSELTSEYFRTYTASKVSVSDPAVTNGSRIIVYTRVWNDTKKKYEFYAIGHDGGLVPCYESGDEIQWTGPMLNSILWNLVEYYWEGTDDPNYYYELYNQYSEQFIAPQVTDGQILSDSTIGINMNGRKDGMYYTPIVAWDDSNYSYAGLKADTAAGRIVSCPYANTDDFYFAIVQDLNVDDTITTVPTVDNRDHGITMKIVNFDDRAVQDDFLGSIAGGAVQTTVPGLLSTDIGADGYPKNAGGTSLATLYAGAKEVNHLFIRSTYDGTGYFEYDSTQNFASLQGRDHGDFAVYREIGTMDISSRPTLKHGQFMPFNDLEAGLFASLNGKNLYSATAQPLPNTDPRKNERLYLVRDPDYYLGLELEASFTQTPDGLDDWGHDIIYEFTGDDDFWLYVDGELIIDLGGIHSALAGSVNFRTGEVTVNGRHTTLRSLFEANYRARNSEASDDAVESYLDGFFKDGGSVFKDNTSHTMRIFYMERGAGASNLHMRFNLASIEKDTVQLSKKLSGIDETESVTAQFPYQVYYTMEEGGPEQQLTDSVFFKGSTTPVPYRPALSIAGVTYENVFLLKPDEVAEIKFPQGTVSYRIVECGVNTTVYKGVKANNEVLDGTPAAANYADYGIGPASTDDRPRVVYDNEVDPEALRTLTVTKNLFAEDGVTPIHNESTAFNYRLYLGAEFDSDLDASPAVMHTYHVKDANGTYCRWDTAAQAFVSIGKSVYADLTAEEKTAASFHTSLNGSISKIPVDYTVEVRNVLAGTQFKVVERPAEIPDGYSFQKYIYRSAESTDAQSGVQDTVVSGSDPHVDVCNLKGWGLRVNKVWTDADFMTDRDPIYFAVFVDHGSGELALVNDTVRRMAYGTTTQYWYFPHLPVAGVAFDHYEIREVILTDPVVDPDGNVTGYTSIQPVADGMKVTLEGMQKGEESSASFEYTTLYERGAISQTENVRTDTVTNNRPGIILRKAAWDGETPLAGASFSLTDGNTLIGTFTSDDTGLITVAFLGDNKDYTLTETSTQGIPGNWAGINGEIALRLSNGTVTVSGVDADYYVLDQGEGKTPTLTIKNRPYTFRAIKIEDATENPLGSVTFALHKQRKVGDVVQFDPEPMTGYASLITNGAGVIPKIDVTLPPGVYELRETGPLPDHLPLAAYIHFTVRENGKIVLDDAPAGVSLVESAAGDGTGTVSYELRIENILMGYELPSTGGFGDVLMQIPGAVLVFGSAAWIRKRKKRRDR